MNFIKRACLLILLLLPTLFFAQKDTSKPATVVETSGRAVMLLKSFYTDAITQKILTQIDATTFLEIKQFGVEENYPPCILEKLEYNVLDPDNPLADDTIKSLKTFQIATFDNVQNGENYGEQSILWIPASSNFGLQNNCNFDSDFYIIIPSKDIKFN